MEATTSPVTTASGLIDQSPRTKKRSTDHAIWPVANACQRVGSAGCTPTQSQAMDASSCPVLLLRPRPGGSGRQPAPPAGALIFSSACSAGGRRGHVRRSLCARAASAWRFTGAARSHEQDKKDLTVESSFCFHARLRCSSGPVVPVSLPLALAVPLL